jgi:hypothetical protein
MKINNKFHDCFARFVDLPGGSILSGTKDFQPLQDFSCTHVNAYALSHSALRSGVGKVA